MRHAYLLTIVPALLFSAGLAAQTMAESPFPNNQYAPTPKALEMIRYGHLSSNLNGGTMEYELPIYTIEDKDFQIPISLRYSSGGFRPNQPTGEAGLGWSLMAGGAVTREIVGLDDFKAAGTINYPGAHSTATEASLYSLADSIVFIIGEAQCPGYSSASQYETTSDIYHFSMPGHSGNFVYHHESQKFLAYGTDDGAGSYEITPESGPSGRYFTIKTGDGYMFQFGDNINNPVERTYSVIPTGNPYGENLSTVDYPIVTWLLKKITAPNGRVVTFSYSGSEPSQTVPAEYNDVVTTFTTYHSGGGDAGPDYYKKASITTTKFLDQIVIDNGTAAQKIVDFNWQRRTTKEINSDTSYEYQLLVAKAKKLQSIQVTCGGQLIRQANLSYTDWGNRPLLSSVSFQGEGTYLFDYNVTNTTPPDVASNAVDFWGFSNGKNVLSSFFSPMSVNEYNNERKDTTFRDPDWNYSVLGMMTKITYPTGGNTSIQYEANRASGIVLRRNLADIGPQPANPTQTNSDDFLSLLWNYSLLFKTNTECGGVRVYSLTDTDLAGTSSTRTFQYTKSDGSTSSGIAQQFPRYYVGRLREDNPLYNPTIHFPGSGFDSRHIAYSRVVETRPDGSKIISEFSDWETTPDTYSPNSQFYSNAHPVDSTMISLQQYQMELLL